MTLQRSILFALAVSAAAASQASFELLLAVDNAEGKVHRFDPVTGISLGSFGQGMMLGPAKIAINESSGVAYVSNYGLNSVQMWNYNTGAYLGDLTNSVTGPWGIVRLDNGNIAIANGALVRTFNSTGSLLSSFSTSGFGLGTDGVNLFAGESGQIRKFSASGTLLGTLLTPGRVNYDIQIRGTTAYSSGANYTNKFGRFNPVTMTGYTETTVSSLSAAADVYSTALSHGAILYVPGSSTAAGNPTVFSRYHTTAGTTISNFGNLPTTSLITGTAIVLAPEPGTMAALGLGAAALLRRRRR